MSKIYTTKESIKSLLGKKVINQVSECGIVSEVDDNPFVAYPIKVTFESGYVSTYTKYGHLCLDSEHSYIELADPRDHLINDLLRIIDERGSDAEELIAILLDEFTE